MFASPADVRPGETVPTRGACGRPPCAAGDRASQRRRTPAGEERIQRDDEEQPLDRHVAPLLPDVRPAERDVVRGRSKGNELERDRQHERLREAWARTSTRTRSPAPWTRSRLPNTTGDWRRSTFSTRTSPPSDSASNVEGRRTETSPAQAVGRADARAHGRADGPADARTADACARSLPTRRRAPRGPDVGADVGAVGAGANRRGRSAQTTERERAPRRSRAPTNAPSAADPAADGAADDAWPTIDARAATSTGSLSMALASPRADFDDARRRGEPPRGPRGDDERDDRHRDRRDGRAPAPAPRRRARDDGPLRERRGGPRRTSPRIADAALATGVLAHRGFASRSACNLRSVVPLTVVVAFPARRPARLPGPSTPTPTARPQSVAPTAAPTVGCATPTTRPRVSSRSSSTTLARPSAWRGTPRRPRQAAAASGSRSPAAPFWTSPGRRTRRATGPTR